MINISKIIDDIMAKGIFVNQDRHELIPFMHSAMSLIGGEPNVIVEIGSYEGGTLCTLASIMHRDGEIISIEPDTNTFKVGIARSIIHPKKLTHICGRSDDPGTYRLLGEILSGRKIDLLFIDGDHRYDIVKSDFILYSRFMNSPGVIGFHDINSIHNHEYSDGEEMVGKYWNFIKRDRPYIEFRHTLFNGYGIGMLYM
jgi:predicted O-methyltransferase YrrM